MNFRIILFVSALLFSACADSDTLSEATIETPEPQIVRPAFVEAESSFTCPHQEEREIFFTSASVKDKLNIQIIGEECESAKIVMIITKSDGNIVHKTTARAFDYIYDDEGPVAVERMLKNLDTSKYYLDALDDIGKLTERNGFYQLNESDAAAAQSGKQPLFCHKAGKSYSNCFAYLDRKSVRVFSSGS